MPRQKYTDMRSVSLTEEQGCALDKQAAAEDRKAGSLIRLAVTQYLMAKGALPSTAEEDEADDEE
jgi:hypothetical protein